MSESKTGGSMERENHTPGPWYVVERTVEPFGHQILTGDGDTPDEKTIADTYAGDVGSAVDGANARLIAAAPELLEAAQDVHDSWERIVPTAELEVDMAALLVAIAKATGQS